MIQLPIIQHKTVCRTNSVVCSVNTMQNYESALLIYCVDLREQKISNNVSYIKYQSFFGETEGR